MVAKIALEEHVLTPGFEDYWKPTMGDVAPAAYDTFVRRLTDFGGERLETMDRAGISRSVLALTGPGVQAEKDPRVAVKRAKEANDFLAGEVRRRPDKFSGFAHLPMQDAKAAADELERSVRELGFVGAMINGHTGGQYLDHPSLQPFWERAEDLGVPIYLHPADPVTPSPALEGHKGLRRATWEWGFETGSHALRLVFGGVFERHPKAQLVLGHLGETLPYLLWRFDSRAKLYGIKLAKPPSQYIRENIFVTVSGMFSREPLDCAVAALGADRVMFSADYPFENSDEAGSFMDTVPLDAKARDDIAFGNAKRLLRLS
jgi:2,3-dihydroxybenzoate decarboxylase